MSDVIPKSNTSAVKMPGVDDLWIVWEETMGHPLSPVRHDNTAVLLLSWDQQDTDDKHASEEVREV